MIASKNVHTCFCGAMIMTINSFWALHEIVMKTTTATSGDISTITSVIRFTAGGAPLEGIWVKTWAIWMKDTDCILF